MNFLWLLAADGVAHVVWSTIIDNVKPLRRLTHKHIINESTNLMIGQLKAIMDDPNALEMLRAESNERDVRVPSED
jgi:hypothetical protein